ncbi:MAG: hypothetical protein QG568_261 [Patescibacteria group bacterium]|nr:hypothetical protein [Patescibacteria group bacterium]
MKTESRLADMHPTRSLRLVVASDGDINVIIEQDGESIGGTDLGDVRAEHANVEFCVSPLRSPYTHRALLQLYEAMQLDNVENPIEHKAW